jgi:hypothetical protein
VLKFQQKSLRKYVELLDAQSTLLNIDFNIQEYDLILSNLLSAEFMSENGDPNFTDKILSKIENPFLIDI